MIADPGLHPSVLELAHKDGAIGSVQRINAMVLTILVLSGYHDTVVSVYAAVSCSLSFLEIAPINFAVRLVTDTPSFRPSFLEGSDYESVPSGV